ncbi:MAG: hypothetical protein HQL36_05920 [Alphaproteobacteria bacterium]|nr:hypothetical protein [Alphaproteobacteria bacterium]
MKAKTFSNRRTHLPVPRFGLSSPGFFPINSTNGFTEIVRFRQGCTIPDGADFGNIFRIVHARLNPFQELCAGFDVLARIIYVVC